MISSRRLVLAAAVALTVVVVLGPGLTGQYLGLLQDGLHYQCSLGDDQVGDAYPAQWVCADGLSYVLPALAHVTSLGSLAAAVTVLAPVRPGSGGRTPVSVLLWAQVVVLAALLLPAVSATWSARGPAVVVTSVAPVVAVVTAALVHLLSRWRAVSRRHVVLLWVLSALVVLVSVPSVAGGAPLALLATWVLSVVAAASTWGLRRAEEASAETAGRSPELR